MLWSFVGYFSSTCAISFWPISVEYRLSQATFSFSPVLEMLCIEPPTAYCTNFCAADVILLSVRLTFCFPLSHYVLLSVSFVWVSVSALVCFLFGPSSLYFYSSQSSVIICLISLLYNCIFMFIYVCVRVSRYNSHFIFPR